MTINFAHNVYDRFKTLKQTIDIEKKYFPESNVCVAYNHNGLKKEDFQAIKNIEFEYFKHPQHKIGCANGFILSLKMLQKHKSDVIFFSHDDVYINENYIDVFQQNVDIIKNGDFDVICRHPKFYYGKNYYMMEGVFMNRKTSKLITDNFNLMQFESQLSKDMRGSFSPEAHLYKMLSSLDVNVKVLDYNNLNDKTYNEQLAKQMGLHHKNAGKRNWKD